MTTTTSLLYLIPKLRLHMGDTDPSAFRYLDDWLELTLLTAVEALQRWWNYKYLIDETGFPSVVYRNPNALFNFAEPPIIENGDIRPIILMSGIILKGGDLQNRSWDVGSWRDAEISYSNIESSRAKQLGYKADWDELSSLVTPPTRKLSKSKKGHLPGYRYNPNEYEKY